MEKKEKILNISIFLFLFLFGLFIGQLIAFKEFSQIIDKQKSNCVTSPTNNIQEKINYEDLLLLIQKAKILEDFKNSRAFYSYRLKKKSGDKIEVEISLNSEEKIKLDAADLQLTFDDDLEVVEIKPGKSFPFYPRRIIKENLIIITGITSINNSILKYGQTNEVFATIVFRKKDLSRSNSNIKLDKSNSKVFFNGILILDNNLSFNEIKI